MGVSFPASVPTPAPPESIEVSVKTGKRDGSDRRADVDAKQAKIAALLEQLGCEGLLVLDQANLAWLTSGALARNVLDPEELPGLYYSPTQRWLLASNVEAQRMFDEEMDRLGFLLKEWPWHWGREQLLVDLCEGRKVAADAPFRDTKFVGDQLRLLRRLLTPYEQACGKLLGELLAHAVEATCRSANPGDSERELAGQVGHRLFHRGAMPVALTVAADGRSKTYRRHAYTSAPIRGYAVLSATARKYGLHATASRSFSFGPPDEKFLNEHLTACKVAATYVASTWPDAGLKETLNTGKRVYLLTGYEHEWQLCPQGYVTGRTPAELVFNPETSDLLQAGWAVTWCPSVGSALSADTFVVTDSGPKLMTPPESWPLLGVRISGNEITRPHILQR